MTLKIRNLAVLAAMLLLAAPAFAQPGLAEPTSDEQATATAQKFMDEGAALYSKADWAGAHVSFLKAWEIVQHRAIATNLADVELRLGLYVQASERLKYLISTLPGDHTDEISSLEAQLAECRRHATSLRITSDVSDATVRLNGKELGKLSALGELIVEPGPATVVLSRPGYKEVQRILYLASGESKTLEFDLEPVATPKPTPKAQLVMRSPAPPPVQDESGLGTRDVVAIGGLTLTAAAGVVGIVYWQKALSTWDEGKRIGDSLGPGSSYCVPGEEVDVATCAKLHSTFERYDREVHIMKGAYVAAGVLGVATVVTYLVWPKKASTPSTAIAPWTTTHGGGATLWGTF